MLPAVVAAVTMPSGQLDGLEVPKNTAASITFAAAASSCGRSCPKISNLLSAATLSGTGIIAAISSAVSTVFSHFMLVTGFRPASPLTKPAIGSVICTGYSLVVLDIFGSLRAIFRNVDCSATFAIISLAVSTGISADASVLPTIAL